MAQSRRNKRKSMHNRGQHGYHGRKPEKHHDLAVVTCERCFTPFYVEAHLTKKGKSRICSRCERDGAQNHAADSVSAGL